MNFLQTRWIGRLAYTPALEMQEKTAAARAKDEVPDQLFLLEHDPVYTIGRQRDRSSLGGTPLPHPVAEISRGGQATFHGPGQLVGYFVFDLQKLTPDLHIFLRWMEEGLIALIAGYGLRAQRRDGLTGVWIGDCKIASIGVGVGGAGWKVGSRSEVEIGDQLVSPTMMYSPAWAFWTASATRGAKGSRSGQRLVGSSMMAIWRPSMFC